MLIMQDEQVLERGRGRVFQSERTMRRNLGMSFWILGQLDVPLVLHVGRELPFFWFCVCLYGMGTHWDNITFLASLGALTYSSPYAFWSLVKGTERVSSSAHHFLQRACILLCPFMLQVLQGQASAGSLMAVELYL